MLLNENDYELTLTSTPRHVSVLTTEYLVKGLDDSAYSAFEAAGDLRRGENEASGFIMTDAVLQPLTLRSAPRNFKQWHIPSMERVVLISAEDEFAVECMLDYWSDFVKPYKVVLYSGPFVIEGIILSDENDPPDFSRYAFCPIQDALITHCSGGSMEIMQVCYGVLHVNHLHGYGIES